jgi:ABC-type microcin C transport system permease subunit YejB
MMNLMKQGKLGIWLSGLCAIHCLLTPILVVALPVAGVRLFESHITEYILFSAGFIFSASTTLNSYFKIHRNAIILLTTFSGFALIVAAHFSSSLFIETTLSVAGSLLVIYGLYKNQSLIKTCTHSAQ